MSNPWHGQIILNQTLESEPSQAPTDQIRTFHCRDLRIKSDTAHTALGCDSHRL